MIYEQVDPAEPLSQGDVLDSCRILVWEVASNGETAEAIEIPVRVIVLTQACDLAQAKATRVVVALVHEARALVEQDILNARAVRDHVRTHRVYGWYFLPAGPNLPESIADLRDLHTLPRSMLEKLARQGKRLCRIVTPYREHLAQHFATTYSRIGLPEPYQTEA